MAQPISPDPHNTTLAREQRATDAVVASYLHDISMRHRPPQSGYPSLRKAAVAELIADGSQALPPMAGC